MRSKIWYMGIFLGIVGFASGLGLAGVQGLTQPIIDSRIIEEGVKPSLDTFFVPAGIECDVTADRVDIDLGVDERGRKQKLMVFKGRKDGKVVAAALKTAVSGFGDKIEVLTLLDLNSKKVLGVKTLGHKETPGLGGRIGDDNEPFIKQFVGLDYGGGVKLKGDGGSVDAISGATVTSKAYADAVNKAIGLTGEHAGEIGK